MPTLLWGMLYIGETIPDDDTKSEGATDKLVRLGSLWSDTTANLLKRCTSLGPVTFTSVEGAGSVLTTKGDLLGYSTALARVPVGADDLPLVGDSGDTEGVSYKVLPKAGGGTGLSADAKVDMYISAAAMKGVATNGAGDANQLPESAETPTNKVNYNYIAFDQTTAEGAFFDFVFPKGWNEGTFTFVFKWTAASGAGTFTLGLKAIALSDDEALDTAFGTEVKVTDTLLAAGDAHLSAESAAVTIGGTPAEGDIVLCQATRDIADTLSADARLMGVQVKFTKDSYTDA